MNAQPPASHNLAHRREIDAICDRFEIAWKSGKQPKIEAFLHLAATADRSILLRELVLLELALITPTNRGAARLDYVNRFPEHEETIADLFHSSGTTKIRAPGVEAAAGARIVQRRLAKKTSTTDRTPDPFRTLGAPETTGGPKGTGPRVLDDLWTLIIGHTGDLTADSTESAAQIEIVVRQLLDAFPARRRDLLSSLLAGAGVQAAADEHAVSLRTVMATREMALELLGGK